MPKKGVMKGMTKIASGAEDINQASIAHFTENGADPRARLNNMGKMGPRSWRSHLSRSLEIAKDFADGDGAIILGLLVLNHLSVDNQEVVADRFTILSYDSLESIKQSLFVVSRNCPQRGRPEHVLDVAFDVDFAVSQDGLMVLFDHFQLSLALGFATFLVILLFLFFLGIL